MPASEFFETLGMFAVKNFLDRNFCAELCNEIEKAPTRAGTFVRPDTKEEVIDEEVKKRKEVTKLSDDYKDVVNKKLLELMPDISSHYKIELSDIQPPKYSIYETGDFYKTHTDSNVQEDAADFLKERKVSTIIFLNEESSVEKEGSYCGGNLTFQGLIDNEVFGGFGLPLISEPGMLITFLPDLLHEVTPVTAGKRFAITTWYI